MPELYKPMVFNVLNPENTVTEKPPKCRCESITYEESDFGETIYTRCEDCGKTGELS